jgi:hypothetical protein
MELPAPARGGHYPDGQISGFDAAVVRDGGRPCVGRDLASPAGAVPP